MADSHLGCSKPLPGLPGHTQHHKMEFQERLSHYCTLCAENPPDQADSLHRGSAMHASMFCTVQQSFKQIKDWPENGSLFLSNVYLMAINSNGALFLYIHPIVVIHRCLSMLYTYVSTEEANASDLYIFAQIHAHQLIRSILAPHTNQECIFHILQELLPEMINYDKQIYWSFDWHIQ